MDIFKIIGVAVLSAAAILCVRQTRQDIAVVLSIASGLIILLMVLNSLTTVITAFNDIAETTGIDNGLFSGVIKIIGVGRFLLCLWHCPCLPKLFLLLRSCWYEEKKQE